MKLSQIKSHLLQLETIKFQLPDGTLVPSYFHVTEVGVITKHFIDCGGTIRNEKTVTFQLWEANDYDHRLHPDKLLSIIELSEKTLGIEDLEVEVEYQGNTIGRYDVGFDGESFLLLNKSTACLATDKCGVSPSKPKVALSKLQEASVSSCAPNSGCC